jgi:hypothetical protein
LAHKLRAVTLQLQETLGHLLPLNALISTAPTAHASFMPVLASGNSSPRLNALDPDGYGSLPNLRRTRLYFAANIAHATCIHELFVQDNGVCTQPYSRVLLAKIKRVWFPRETSQRLDHAIEPIG